MSNKFKLNKGYISQRINGKTTIFSGEESTLYTLNDVGGFIVEGIKLGWDNDVIALRLTEKFNINQEAALKDVKHFFNILMSKKIITKR